MKTLSRICSAALVLAGVCIPSLSQAVSIKIERSGAADKRAISDVRCGVEFNYNNKHYYDYQGFDGAWPTDDEIHWGLSVNNSNHPWTCDANGQCTGDGLYWVSDVTSSGIGQRIIIAKEDDPVCYEDPFPADAGHNIRVDCWFKINGDWHYDWEDFYPSEMTWGGGAQCTYQNDISLYLNGCNGTWNGSEWVGDFLRRDPGSPSPC